MNYLKKGLLKTARAIKEHKWLFAALILLQLVFLAVTIYATISYEIKILENAQGIIEPLQDANYDAESIQQGTPFTEEMAAIYSNYLSMTENIKQLVIILLFLYIFFNGGMWVLTHRLLEKETWKNISRMWLKIFMSTLVLVVPLILAAYYALLFMLKMEVSFPSLTTVLNIIFCLSVIVYYFLISSFAVINERPWKEFVKMLFNNSVKRIHKSLLVLMINLILISLSLYAIYLAINYEHSLFLLIASGLLLVVILALTRIFWVACMKGIARPKENETRKFC